jgi:hypothetical protein
MDQAIKIFFVVTGLPVSFFAGAATGITGLSADGERFLEN